MGWWVPVKRKVSGKSHCLGGASLGVGSARKLCPPATPPPSNAAGALHLHRELPHLCEVP